MKKFFKNSSSFFIMICYVTAALIANLNNNQGLMLLCLGLAILNEISSAKFEICRTIIDMELIKVETEIKITRLRAEAEEEKEKK